MKKPKTWKQLDIVDAIDEVLCEIESCERVIEMTKIWGRPDLAVPYQRTIDSIKGTK